MDVFETVTFAIGDDVGVPLPDDWGFEPDMDVTIEREGNVVTVRPRISPPTDSAGR